ncbi:MAG: cysteine desulfurase-like protein [Planctomycetia bacterium]|nr:cysteine desulfurase-like protein [Planctomycetia bacterium]
MSALDVDACRREFPGLQREIAGRPAVFFDGPAGSQVPRRVADAVARYLLATNANHEGVFATSRESDEILAAAHRSAADFLGCGDPDEIVFGANMTSLTLALSRALARTWRAGDQILVTQSEHDANYTPWVLAAKEAEATVDVVEINPSDCTLSLDDLRRKLSRRTRLLAVGCASNATGTVHPVGEIAELVRAAGAELFLDAVHYAPHRLIDVAGWDCDYLVCSAYKFFGPHLGILWGRRQKLESLPARKLRTAPDSIPGRWMTGTQNHEGIAGVLEAIDYLADLGRRAAPGAPSRRLALEAAYESIGRHERLLAEEMLRGAAELPSLKLYGVTDLARLGERVPTFCFTHRRFRPRALAEHLAERGIFAWHGNYYALPLTERLGLEPDGALRVGFLHYNTREEVQRLLAELRALEA